MEGLVGFEPTLRELQSRALPLGYRSVTNTIISKQNYNYNTFYEKKAKMPGIVECYRRFERIRLINLIKKRKRVPESDYKYYRPLNNFRFFHKSEQE